MAVSHRKGYKYYTLINLLIPIPQCMVCKPFIKLPVDFKWNKMLEIG